MEDRFVKEMAHILDVRPYELMYIVCRIGQGSSSDLGDERLTLILGSVRNNPIVPIRLRCNTYTLFSFQNPGHDEDTGESELVNCKRDLDILQRLGLVPGATRPALDLFRRLLKSIPDAKEICGFSEAGGGTWRGSAAFSAEDYAKGHALGIEAIIPPRDRKEMARVKKETAQELYNAEGLRIRPHHLMCMACLVGDQEDIAPIEEDHIVEVVDIIRKNPDIRITLVRGCCMICPPCSDYHPSTGLCIGGESMGLRDHKKDLDVLRILGLKYGDSLPARQLLADLFAKIHSTIQICGFGDGIERSPEWKVCSGPDGNENYVKARAVGLRVPGVVV